MALIELDGACKAYGKRALGYALQPTTLNVDEGEYVAITGKSGSGKTTLLNLIAGLDTPTSGSVIVSGRQVPKLSEGARARWRSSSVGVVFQFYQLLPAISIIDNILLAMSLSARPIKGDRGARARELVRLVGIEGEAHRLPSSLSGGQQQRAAIARALANEPPLLLMDEPTGSIDSESTESVLGLLDNLHAQGRTIVVVTHDDDVARRAGRQLTLHDGGLVADVRRAAP
ncbi:MAG: ABC transporter ATP-binding protein [Hyphomonadaceae bacterium]